MERGMLAFHFTARHGYAIERLKRDMAAEESREHLVDFLAYDAASFVYGFLLASGNELRPEDRVLHVKLREAIAGVLANFGFDRNTFVVQPEIDAPAPLPDRDPVKKP